MNLSASFAPYLQSIPEPAVGTWPSPHSRWGQLKDTLLSWLSLTLCTTILIDSESALNQFHCIQFLAELGRISAALLSPEDTLVVYIGCSS